MVSDRTIEKWVRIVNKEIGRSDRNEYCLNWFKSIKGIATFDMHKEWYMIYMIVPNMWGDRELNIISLYVHPKHRTGKNFLTIQRKIKDIAIKNKVRYTIQGSHIDNKYFKFLKGIGYEVAEMRKEY